MVQIYRKNWARGYLQSLFGYIRDGLVLLLPIKKLPAWLVRVLYGVNPRFAFLVHPRTYEDIFISAPFFQPIKIFVRRKNAYHFFTYSIPYVINSVRTAQGIDGIVIGHPVMPELIFTQRKQTVKMIEKALNLVAKIGVDKAVIGLGGWFPMVTDRGASLQDFANSRGLIVTNGHCGTLASIYLMTEKIAKLAELNMKDMSLAIVGVGKMGMNVAKAFVHKVGRLILIDLKEVNLKKVYDYMKKQKTSTAIEKIIAADNNVSEVKKALKKCHVGIFATSSLRNLLRLKDLPEGFIAIDDSRPEAIPRDPKLERIILEGGLLRIHGAKLDYNYGFGQDDNVFGCLGEAFLLALNQSKSLQPTLGDVDNQNFHELIRVCKANNVSEGDLKSSCHTVSPMDIKKAMNKRRLQAS